jgi:hypothetical protein
MCGDISLLKLVVPKHRVGCLPQGAGVATESEVVDEMVDQKYAVVIRAPFEHCGFDLAGERECRPLYDSC